MLAQSLFALPVSGTPSVGEAAPAPAGSAFGRLVDQALTEDEATVADGAAEGRPATAEAPPTGTPQGLSKAQQIPGGPLLREVLPALPDEDATVAAVTDAPMPVQSDDGAAAQDALPESEAPQVKPEVLPVEVGPDPAPRPEILPVVGGPPVEPRRETLPISVGPGRADAKSTIPEGSLPSDAEQAPPRPDASARRDAAGSAATGDAAAGPDAAPSAPGPAPAVGQQRDPAENVDGTVRAPARGEPAPAIAAAPPPPPSIGQVGAEVAPPTALETPASPPATSAGLGLSRVAHETLADLTAQVVRRLEAKVTRFDMALTPEDLGQVDVRLELADDGSLTARLHFDTPAAAAEMRAQADQLRRQLEQAGFQLARDALEFSHRDGSSSRQDGFERRPGRAFAAARDLAETAEVTPLMNLSLSLGSARDRVDVKV